MVQFFYTMHFPQTPARVYKRLILKGLSIVCLQSAAITQIIQYDPHQQYPAIKQYFTKPKLI